jgi:resuscitation-promoting factor RpfA
MRSRLRIASIVIALFAGLAPALVIVPADAASMRTWNRLARCESGGRWHINTGNGYYGGLQFSAPTWRGYGGRRFARNAHRATKYEQIRIAERVRRNQGWGAWPHCSRKLGLGRR